MLREHIEAGDQLGSEVRAVIRAGHLVPDEMVNRLVEERIDRPDCKNGFILDGYPRTLNQAEAMSDLLVARQIAPSGANVAETGGNLVITAKNQSVGGQPYTSGKLETSGKFSVQYGRIEASIQVPEFQGSWPASGCLAPISGRLAGLNAVKLIF